VENKVGAFGNIATEYVAKSKPDGYTIYIAPANLLAIAPHLYTKLSYDPINDFEHVTTLFKLPFLLTVAADSPYKNVADLVKHLKEKGDKASYGSVSTVSLVSAELFKAQFGLQTVEVKYKESQAGVTDLLGGNLAFIYIDPAGSAAQIKAGKLRALVVTTKERVAALPDIPGSAEAGIMNSDVFSWWTVHTPKGTPKPILDKLETIFNKIAVDEETVKFLGNLGSDPFPGNSTMLKELLVKDIKAWGEYVKIAHIEAT
jgi:tripartite-type tricarboxylate transporter receptor subunit TctC